MLVFDTVVKECGLDPAVVTAPPARPLAGAPAAGPPAPRPSQGGTQGVSGGLLDVYRVYAAVFDALPQPLSSNAAASLLLQVRGGACAGVVHSCLQVLMAAQEPLSHSLLY